MASGRLLALMGLAALVLLVVAGGGIFLPSEREHERVEGGREARHAARARVAENRPAPREAGAPGLIPFRRLDRVPTPEATVSWDRAAEYLGRTVAAEGTVVRTRNIGRICFLNFDEDWEGKFCGVIFSSTFADYSAPPEELFLGKRVRLTGEVGEYRGTPQIVVEHPGQIEILEP